MRPTDSMNNEFNYIHYKYDIAISLTITNLHYQSNLRNEFKYKIT